MSNPPPADPDPAQPPQPLDYAKPQQGGGVHDPYVAFRYPAFRLFAPAQALSVVGAQMLATTAAWQLYQITKSEFSLGLLGLLQAAPVILLSLLAGHVADVYSRKRVLVTMQFALVACPLVLALLQYRGVTVPAWIYVVMLVNAAANTFARPARGSLLPTLVPQHVFPNAVTWNSSIFELSSVAGPAVGGLVLGYHGAAAALTLSAALLGACMALTLLLPDPGPAGERKPFSFETITAGLKFVFRTRLLLATMSLDLFAVLFGGATYLLPVFADRLGVGPAGFGWMRAAPALGAGAMALIQAHRRPWNRAGRAMLLAVAGFSAATIVFGLSTNYWLSLAMLLLIGVFDNISVVVRHSLVQLLTPDAMRGRVTAVNQVFIGSSNEIGGFESGATAALMGPVGSVVFGGCCALGVVGAVAATFPEVRNLGKLTDVLPPADPEETAVLTQEAV
jgi:MFS family permease